MPRPYARPASQPPPTLPALQGLLRPGWAFPLVLRMGGAGPSGTCWAPSTPLCLTRCWEAEGGAKGLPPAHRRVKAEAALRTPPWPGPAPLPGSMPQHPSSGPPVLPPARPPLPHVPILPNAPAPFSCLAPIPPCSTAGPSLSAGSARGPHPASLHPDLQTPTPVHAHTRSSVQPSSPCSPHSGMPRPDRGQGQCLPRLCPQHTGAPGHSWEGHCPGSCVGESPSWPSSTACKAAPHPPGTQHPGNVCRLDRAPGCSDGHQVGLPC